MHVQPMQSNQMIVISAFLIGVKNFCKVINKVNNINTVKLKLLTDYLL